MPDHDPPRAGALMPLTYGGKPIHDRGETVSLTDMWRAAGSPKEKRPADWLAQVSTKDFVSHVEATLDAGQSGIQTAKGGRGVGGSTFAHWQIGLAYAKYLSHDFHMWANTAVRDRMREVHETSRLTASPGDPATVLQVIQHLQAQIAAQTPRVAALDRLEGAEGSRCITDTAKLLKMSRAALTRWMVAERWIYRRPNTETWLPFRDKEVALLLESVPYHYTGRDGTPRVRMQVLVTSKGLIRLASLLNESFHKPIT
ncbi:MAG: phage antirepressor KilAC domain-containing protein [Methylorubrum rhodinum]|uniref:phage antirepressor KilAC domain-containing protein n=1 Tax=Methylorubrum rhodinum TaxID=29428 RepID=UPI003BAF0E98